MATYLREIGRQKGFHIDIEEVDIARRLEDDLSLQSKQEEFLEGIREGRWDAVICTPPCSTWSRVRAANLRGPPPLRDRNYPWGYPWIKQKFQREVLLGNTLVEFTIRVVEAVLQCSVVFWPFLLVEHPEDLGAVIREEDGAKLHPASIWQLDQLRKLVQKVVRTVALNQCCWGTSWRKPTRLITTSDEVASWGPTEWPSFDGEGFYVGPLAKTCDCKVTMSLAKKSNDEQFRTTGTATYPHRLDQAIAEAIVSHCKRIQVRPPKVGQDGPQQDELQEGGQDEKEELQKEMIHSRQETVEIEKEVRKEEGTEENRAKSGFGKPMRCFYKGKHRTVHDGGGLCSPGRWPRWTRGSHWSRADGRR